MNNLIELQDVNLIRNGKSLLKEINWQVKENECWAILGLNGAGKSTLLKLLMSEYWASSGHAQQRADHHPECAERIDDYQSRP